MMHDSDDKLFAARLSDIVNRSERDGICCFSNFFDERQCAEAERWCMNNTGELKYMLYGGFANAERRILAVFPNYYEDYIIEEFPIKCLTFSFRKEDRLSHRDFLGSFMAIRLKRETIGDIIIADGVAQVFVSEVAAKAIMSDISKIGRVGVKISDSEPFYLSAEQSFEDIGGTVASLRLDCIVGAAAKVSRENAARLIRSERVNVNHLPASSVSQELHEGDIVTIRGSGKFIFNSAGGTTKKGRIHINLRKYK